MCRDGEERLACPSARSAPVLGWTRGSVPAGRRLPGLIPRGPVYVALGRPAALAHGAQRAWGFNLTKAAGPDGLCLTGVPEVPVQAEVVATTPDPAHLCHAESTSNVLTRSLVSGEMCGGSAPLSAYQGPQRHGVTGPSPTGTTSLANATLPRDPDPPSGWRGVRRQMTQGTWRHIPGPRSRLAGRSPVRRRH